MVGRVQKTDFLKKKFLEITICNNKNLHLKTHLDIQIKKLYKIIKKIILYKK